MYLGICQHCKKRDATHSTVQQINGKVTKSYLCDICYEDVYGALKSGFPFWMDLLEGTPVEGEKRCDMCGMKFSEYEKTGLLGCPSCYDVFKNELLPHIEKIQGGVNHIGKVGKNYSTHDLIKRINALQKQLEQAIKASNYDEAGRINRIIEGLQKNINGGNNV